VVCIFFWGAVFSPYYAGRLRAGALARPGQHAAVHLATYRDGKRTAWLLAERDASREPPANDTFRVGASSLTFAPSGVATLEVDDRGPARLSGRLRFHPLEPALSPEPVSLSPGLADHRWHALMPRARVEVELQRPGLTFEGSGYLDTNWGSEPMERKLAGWNWARTHSEEGARVVYDVRARDGRRFLHTLGTGTPLQTASAIGVPAAGTTTGWGVALPAELDFRTHRLGTPGAVIESAPFYARYEVRDAAGAVCGLGESLDLMRFDRAMVRWMLRWKTYRHAGSGR
jgi:carotenoid 1,2-hydratase